MDQRDVDSGSREIQPQTFAEGVQSRLGRRVDTVARRHHQRRERGHVHDRPAAALQHLRDRRVRRPDARQEIETQRRLDVLVGDAVRELVHRDRRVVDEHVDATAARDGLVDDAPGEGALAEIAGEMERPLCIGDEFGDESAQLRFAPCHDDHGLPRRARARAVSRPIPAEAPVTTQMRSCSSTAAVLQGSRTPHLFRKGGGDASARRARAAG